MILIADGGSTKTDWHFISPNGEMKCHQSKGFNPHILGDEQLRDNMQSSLKELFELEVEEIHFFGAGCSSEVNINRMKNAFSSVFKNTNTYIYDDMLGAAKALSGDKAGVCCILGTGSNACIYDGEKVTSQLTSLGYIAGDEGSGNHLGKKLLKAYFKNQLPRDLTVSFGSHFQREKIVDNIYAAERPNVYLASFSKFMAKHIENETIRTLVKESFEDFFEEMVFPLGNIEGYIFHFTGSIAFHFQEILKEVLEDLNLHCGKIIKKPIDGLKEYYLQKLKAE